MALLKFIFGDDVAACLNRQYKDGKAFSQIKAFGIGFGAFLFTLHPSIQFSVSFRIFSHIWEHDWS
jgi:hypothetical protein